MRALLVAAVAGALLLPSVQAASAQGGSGYLFKEPAVRLGLRMGYAVPRAGSDIFAFTREELTVDRRDFDAQTLGGEVAVRVTPRIDVALNVSYARSETFSEFREWVDLDDRPIDQETRFRRTPVTLGVKYYFFDHGRSVGRFAWVPRKWNAFMGAGAGWVWYEFVQEGDFVDYQTLDIFTDRFRSEGRAPTVHLFAGGDYSLGPNLFVTAEGRYAWADREMGSDFVDFEPIDLSGFQLSLGISARF